MKTIQQLVKIVFPDVCNICKKRIFTTTDLFCVTCSSELEYTHIKNFENNIVLDKFKGILPIQRAYSMLFVSKGNLTSQILYQIKYDSNSHMAENLGILIGNQLKNSDFSNADLLIPIPLHKSKKSQRGFNQSEILADGISKILNIKIDSTSVVRTKYTNSQTFLNKEERQDNVRNVFHVTNQNMIQNKKVILIDDVITTGSTIEACAQEILKAGASEIMLLSLAIANEI